MIKINNNKLREYEIYPKCNIRIIAFHQPKRQAPAWRWWPTSINIDLSQLRVSDNEVKVCWSTTWFHQIINYEGWNQDCEGWKNQCQLDLSQLRVLDNEVKVCWSELLLSCYMISPNHRLWGMKWELWRMMIHYNTLYCWFKLTSQKGPHLIADQLEPNFFLLIRPKYSKQIFITVER